MRTIIRNIFIAAFFTYIIFCFAIWDVNPKTYCISQRIAMVIVSAYLAVVFSVIESYPSKTKDK